MWAGAIDGLWQPPKYGGVKRVPFRRTMNAAPRHGMAVESSEEMNLKTAIVLTVLAVAGNAAELGIEHAAVEPGKPTQLNVKLTSGTEAPTGIQFDIEYDAVSLDVSIEAGPAAVQAGKSMRSAPTKTGQRVLIIGFNRNVILNGVVATLHVSLKVPGVAGQVFPLHLTGTSGTNERAETLAVTGNDGSVKVEMRRNGQ